MYIRDAIEPLHSPPDLCLKSRPNWTATIFFAVLSALHFSISIPAFLNQRWEGYLSFVLAWVFVIVAVAAYFARYEMTILPRDGSIRLRSGIGKLRIQRFVPFSDVHAVRLTISHGKRSTESIIEVLCDNEDIECPATTIPRQQALFLAVLMKVELIKVSNDGESSEHGDRAF